MKISVIVCTKNRPHQLANCFTSLTKQSRLPEEIVVVYHSLSDLREIDQNQFPNLKLVRCRQPNLSTARNLGIRQSCGHILAFLDDDCVAKPNWLENIARHFCKAKNSVIVMGKNLNPVHGHFYSFVENNRVQKTITKHLLKRKNKLQTLMLDGKNFAVRKSFLVRQRLFFDQRFKNIFEDVDFGWQIWSLGFGIDYNPTIVVVHFGRSNLYQHLRRELNLGYNYQILQQKWESKMNQTLASAILPIRLKVDKDKSPRLSKTVFIDAIDYCLRTVGRAFAILK